MEKKRSHLLSDERYCLLLDFCIKAKTVGELWSGRKLDPATKKWLYHATSRETYKYIPMEYKGQQVSEMDKGAVLVCFKEPDPLSVRGDAFVSRPSKSASELTFGTMRRCIPVSQIESALNYCHVGGLKVSHFGMDTTYSRCLREFDGITRELARRYVASCPVCQQKKPKQHKAKLVPILANKLFDRIVIDVVIANMTPQTYCLWQGTISPKLAATLGHLLILGKRLSAASSNAVSTKKMAADYDASSKVHHFNQLDAVAVRIPGKKPRSGDGTNSLPGLVVGIYEKNSGERTPKVVHRMYTVWCPYGVLSESLPVDRLNKLSINSFTELLTFRDETLTDAERLPRSDPNWRSPMTGTALNCPKISLKHAWAAHPLKYTQPATKQSRNRSTGTRPAATAADTAMAIAKVDHRAGVSLSTVSNQAVPQPAPNPSASRIVEILDHNKTQYKVRYSQPVGNPEEGSVGQAWLNKRAEYADVVNAYWQAQIPPTQPTATAPKKRAGKPQKRVEDPLQEEVESVMEDETAEEADEGDEMEDEEQEWEPENDDMADVVDE